jgi:hypothetical protein
MIQQSLIAIGLKISDSFLGLQMRKGMIADGEHQIDGFVQSILEK